MSDLWKIHLLGGLSAVRSAPLAAGKSQFETTLLPSGEESESQVIERFRTQKTAGLLAYLAFYPQCHAREVLIEKFWPDGELRNGYQNLRTAIASLRRQFEPPGVAEGTVLISTRTHLQLNPRVVSTDVNEFLRAAHAAKSALPGQEDKFQLLERVVDRYRGQLLPGFYDDWVALEARNLEEEYFALLHELLDYLEAAGDLSRALHYACIGVRLDSSRQTTRSTLKRLCIALDIPFDSLEVPALGGSAGAKTRRSRRRKPALAEITPPQLTQSGQSVSAPRLPHISLPALLNKFFGREEEVARVCEEFLEKKTRLLTLTGPGGSGKTRLAVEAVRQLTSQSGENRAVYYVPLADLRSANLIAGAIVDEMALLRVQPLLKEPSPEVQLVERLAVALSAQPTLLVLDNFEHVAVNGAPLLESLLSRISTLQVLTTSQHRLNISGERALAVDALPIPLQEISPPVGPEQLATLMGFPAVQLFLDRAQTVSPDFQITRHNAGDVASVCRLLEGIPLALELAAARCNVFSPGQIVTRLKVVTEKFDTLVSVRRPATPRHSSLQSAIAWSYQLLPPELAHFWAQLSVFSGGFTLEAAEVVCETPEAPHHLGQLRAYSLLAVEERGGVMRFRLLEMLREFAAAQLDDASRQELSLRHARYFTESLAAHLSFLRTSQEAGALAQVALETDNARSALDWASERDDYQLTSALALSLGTLLQRRGLHRDALCVIEKGLCAAAKLKQQTHLQGSLLREHCGLLIDLEQWEEAERAARNMLKLYSPEQQAKGVAEATNLLGLVAKGQKQWQKARKYFRDALHLFQDVHDEGGMANARNNLGLIEYLSPEGNKAVAASQLNQVLQMRDQAKDMRGVAETYINLGALAQETGELEEARSHYCEALEIEMQLQHSFGIGRALCNLGEVAEGEGNPEFAYRCYAAAHALFEQLGAVFQQYSADRAARLAAQMSAPSVICEKAHALTCSGEVEELVAWVLDTPQQSSDG